MPACLNRFIPIPCALTATAAFCLACGLLASSPSAAEEGTRLLRNPAVSQAEVAFVYANDIWITSLKGGAARRLTIFEGAETLPHFSPDGSRIAFSGEYDGNVDVYVVSAQGGEPKRLTWHRMPDKVRGWSNDGKYILFTSGRDSVPDDYPKFWRVSVEGGLPEPLPIPRAAEGKYAPDGKKFVYQEISPWETEWRNYRGGQNNPVRILDLESLAVEKLPWDGANDNTPVWLDNSIYFLSDRDGTMNVWSYSVDEKKLRQRTFFTEFDCKQLEAGSGKLVFENGGWLHLFDPAADKPEKLSIAVQGDFPLARPRWEGAYQIENYALSPTGQRAVFEARGEIFTVPAKKGDVRNLTASSGTADRSPAWSPDGKQISWFSDEGGEYQLVIADQYGKNKKTIELDKPTFFYSPAWSPDSQQISFSDAARNLWLLDLKTEKSRLIDNENFTHPERVIVPVWSPDSKWLAYVKRLKNQYKAIFLYSLEQNKSFQLTDGLSDCASPAWDQNGKYLYFLASTNFGLNVGWADMSSGDRPVTRAVYLVVLAKGEPSPLLPESDEENKPDSGEKEKEKKETATKKDIHAKKKEEEKKKKEKKSDDTEKKEQVKVKIDFDGISQRIIAFDLSQGDYSQLAAGADGNIFYLEREKNRDEHTSLHRFSLKERKDEVLSKDAGSYVLSADGKKILFAKGVSPDLRLDWAIADADSSPELSGDPLKITDMRTHVDPKQEWRQIFREAWRFERDFFYVRNIHGLDLDWAWKTYSPWLEHVRHRTDLTYLLDMLGGETSVGHSFTGGGDLPWTGYTPMGLLGADFSIEQGRCRLKKIYTGENWNPQLRAPLSGPSIDVKEGDFLLAVNGVELTGAMNPYSLFEETANRQTVLTVNSQPVMAGSREVTVVPTSFDFGLRIKSWVDANRKKVDELSGGKLAYIWLPNTGLGGYNFFNRYYFAQQDKKGAVIDERFNTGGMVPDYIIDLLERKLLGFFNNAAGDHQPFTLPNAGIWGPKVMIINDASGSGGDLLPYMFRQKKIGPLIGTRTWGGLVGIWDVPPLMDGGYLTVPRGGFYNLRGEWDVENKGVAPDIVVEQDPAAVSNGHDPQLEKAVEVALELLKTQEVKILPQPPDPVRVRRAASK